ncbi:uncharacterized protein TERG_06381 [Trichophyton rubrum CBS 118892]|uniref:Uncharacterized protein n=1 Tax=Trichophyton rubrum (strain ATCC MYA-4607 / CBS 118892) TaxID=559305 RepID=F2SV89_TRIRC|nr:uncharacterized protein TERG_06381 [Trichophyton rubrum CBS 118892]EGD90151.2 hypothetical protein TERG_06381 [Trichophyton rubrum CBS 118892]
MACSGNAWHGEGSVSDSAPDPSPLSSPSSGARMSPVTLHKGASQAPSPVCLQPVIVDQAPGTRHQVFLSPPCQSQQTLKDKSSRNPVTGTKNERAESFESQAVGEGIVISSDLISSPARLL